MKKLQLLTISYELISQLDTCKELGSLTSENIAIVINQNCTIISPLDRMIKTLENK